MRIDGRLLADTILARLSKDVSGLKRAGLTPTLAVVLVGDNPASLAYIRQKQKAADSIGARLIFDHQPDTITAHDLAARVRSHNDNPAVHGLIVQRPIPPALGDVTSIVSSVHPEKDVDGFIGGSPFPVPVAAAVGEILKSVYTDKTKTTSEDAFLAWLRKQSIAVIGRGETAGRPILRFLKELHCTTSNIHSHTPNPARVLKLADIIISCVGKEHVVTGQSIKSGAILVGVGIWRDQQGKLRGDYDEEDIENIASAYTPTPRGVGPVNVACLMQNLVKACKMISKDSKQ